VKAADLTCRGTEAVMHKSVHGEKEGVVMLSLAPNLGRLRAPVADSNSISA